MLGQVLDQAGLLYRAAKTRRSWQLTAGAAITAIMLYFVFRGFNYQHLAAVTRHTNPFYAGLIPVSIIVELVARAWKWRQFLSPLTDISTLATLRAFAAGFVPGLAIGMGSSVVTRAWLVARRDPKLSTQAVIATIAVDRLTDSLAFALFVAAALISAPLPASAHGLRTGVAVGGGLVLAIAVVLLWILFRHGLRYARLPRRLARRLPRRWVARYRLFVRGAARGVVWPRARRAQAIIVLTALVIKGLATVQLLWAGLALGILLPGGDYLFLMVFFGLWVVVGFVVAIPGSTIVVSIFILGLFGIEREAALAMTLMVGASFLLTFGGLGILCLWLEGFRLRR
jgi:hypothetical protein